MYFQSVLLLITIINHETFGFQVCHKSQELREDARCKRFTSTHPTNVDSERNGDVDEEVVGLMPLAHLRAARARARARALRNRAKARLHHPFLLQETPQQILGDDDVLGEERPQRDLHSPPIEVPYTSYSMEDTQDYLQEPEEESEIYKMHPELRENSMEANLHIPELMPGVVLPIFQIAVPKPMEAIVRSYEKDSIPNVYVDDGDYYSPRQSDAVLMAAHHGGHPHFHAPPHPHDTHQTSHFPINNHKATIVVPPNSAQHFRNAPFVDEKSDTVVGSPYIIDISQRLRHHYPILIPKTSMKMVVKRSLDNFYTMDRLPRNISKTKRTIPLLRLVVDPNTKVDVPKTLENMGTIMRGSLENKRAPLYHLKNVVGSTRDTFMSTLKIPPHDLFIPSKYKIVEKNSAKSAQNDDVSDPNDFDETYKKIGTMLRDSIRSGQETLANVGEIYHSARKTLATSRHAVPRVILSSLRVPSVRRDPPFLKTNKTAIFTPKVVHLKQEAVGIPHYSDSDGEFVGFGRVMDALGISNPDADPIEFREVVISPMNEGEIRETLNALDNAKETMGARNIRDFVSQMRSGLSTTFKEELSKVKNRKKDEDDVVGAVNPEYFLKLFNETLESAQRSVLEGERGISKDDEGLVGVSMKMGKKLLTPFMGKVEQEEIQVYPNSYVGDNEEDWGEDDGYLGGEGVMGNII